MEDSPGTALGVTPPPVVRALRRLLRPLVRLLLHQQFTYPMFIRLLKAVYVEIAAKEFPVVGKAQTDSRISLLTGVHRKDVKRLWREEAVTDGMSDTVTLGAQLVAWWTTDPKYLDAAQRPRPLPRLAGTLKAVSFETLVASVNTDIRPRAVLDEWLRLGVVQIDDSDQVCLVIDAFVPEKGLDEKAFFFGQNIHDHLAACTHNLLARSPALLERCIFTNDLSSASVAELAEIARESGMRAIHAVSKRAIELERNDVTTGTASERINFGVYFFTEARHPDESTPTH